MQRALEDFFVISLKPSDDDVSMETKISVFQNLVLNFCNLDSYAPLSFKYSICVEYTLPLSEKKLIREFSTKLTSNFCKWFCKNMMWILGSNDIYTDRRRSSTCETLNNHYPQKTRAMSNFYCSGINLDIICISVCALKTSHGQLGLQIWQGLSQPPH